MQHVPANESLTKSMRQDSPLLLSRAQTHWPSRIGTAVLPRSNRRLSWRGKSAWRCRISISLTLRVVIAPLMNIMARHFCRVMVHGWWRVWRCQDVTYHWPYECLACTGTIHQDHSIAQRCGHMDDKKLFRSEMVNKNKFETFILYFYFLFF